jgi:hypothetical protein
MHLEVERQLLRILWKLLFNYEKETDNKEERERELKTLFCS